MRALVRENHLRVEDFIYPIFIIEGENIRNEISRCQVFTSLSLDNLSAEMDEIVSLGIKSVLLFGVPNEKDELAQVLIMIMELFKRQLVLLKNNFRKSLWLLILVFVNIQAMVIVE